MGSPMTQRADFACKGKKKVGSTEKLVGLEILKVPPTLRLEVEVSETGGHCSIITSYMEYT